MGSCLSGLPYLPGVPQLQVNLGPNLISINFLTAPPSVPNVNGHAFNRTAINVTWDIALPKGFKLRGFNVTYGWQNVTYRWQNVTYRWQNETYRWQNETVRVNEPERTVALTGLEVSTEYEIKVAAATNYQGNYSQAILVKTEEGGEG